MIELSKHGKGRLVIFARNFAKRFGLDQQMEENLRQCVESQLLNELESHLPNYQKEAAKKRRLTKSKVKKMMPRKKKPLVKKK